MSDFWTSDCQKWRGRVLTGDFAHYCDDWDGLPVDETTAEFTTCKCFEGGSAEESARKLQAQLREEDR